MTRPDPRLLVPVSVLPFVPAGALVIDEDGRQTIATLDDLAAPRWGRSACVDLSAPTRRDGLDERLDAERFATDVLAKRLGYTGDANESASFWHSEGACGISFADDAGDHEIVEIELRGTDVPDVPRNDPNTAYRMILCAALRARGGSRE